MTVGELIQELEKMPKDMKVARYHHEDVMAWEIVEVVEDRSALTDAEGVYLGSVSYVSLG